MLNDDLEPMDWLVAAGKVLEYALSSQNVRRAVQALTDVGRAGATSPHEPTPSPSTRDLASAAEWGTLTELFQRDPTLISVAAAVGIVQPWRDHQEDGLQDSLMARSGYQMLLDRKIWTAPPVDDFHLGEVDEELLEAVREFPQQRPANLPAAHFWWGP